MTDSARPLRVALDVSALRLGNAGVARATRGLAAALEARSDIDLILLGDGPAPAAGSVSRRALALHVDLAWHPRGARRAAAAQQAAILHTPLARGPLTPGGPPTVVTIHDLAAIRHAHTLSRWNRLYTSQTLPRVLATATAIVAVSQDTADDIAAYAPEAAARVTVIPNGVGADWSEPPVGPGPIAGPFVLAVGTPEPRKNLRRLVNAMAKRRSAGAPERLVLVGADGWGDEPLPHAPWLIRLGRVSDRDLRLLYRDAVAVAIPSLHEGSGLPVLEAFASGTPVVAARAGALPETCGAAAVLVDPFNIRDIAGGIDEAIARHDELVPAGRELAAAATWERAAEAYVDVYRTLAAATGDAAPAATAADDLSTPDDPTASAAGAGLEMAPDPVADPPAPSDDGV